MSPRRPLHYCVTLTLLAVYGSVGVLGYGLHELFHVHHHPAASHGDVSMLELLEQASGCQSEGACGCSHTHALHAHTPSQEAENYPVVSTTEEPCSICHLLTQAQQPALVVSFVTRTEAAPAASIAEENLFPLFVPGERLARGPPTC